METNVLSIDSLYKPIKVFEQDLTADYGVDITAFRMLEMLQDKVSDELWNMLYQMVLPFDGDMQVEMASDILEFADFYQIYTTGCPSADATLEACYRWIAEERGLSELAKNIKLYKFK